MSNTHRSFRSFISKVSFFQELQDSNKVKVWVKTRPEWLPHDQPLYLYTNKFKADTLKGMYYTPGNLEFFVDDNYEVHEIKFVRYDYSDKKCTIL